MLNRLPIRYRWSTRMIYLDQHEALSELRKYPPQVEAAGARLLDADVQDPGRLVNEDALLMATETEAAIDRSQFGPRRLRLLHAGDRAAGHRSRRAGRERAHGGSRGPARAASTARIETVNTMEAWLGAYPGSSSSEHPPPVRAHPEPGRSAAAVERVGRAGGKPVPLLPGGLPCRCCTPRLTARRRSGSTSMSAMSGTRSMFGPTGAGKSVLLCHSRHSVPPLPARHDLRLRQGPVDVGHGGGVRRPVL